MRKIIKTNTAPAPIGPYNQAVAFGNLLFVSGQIALNPETGELDDADLTTETRRVMSNLQAVLTAAGTSFDQAIKTTIFLSDMSLFGVVNKIYEGYFTEGNAPARETVAVKGLPRNVNVEISMIVGL